METTQNTSSEKQLTQEQMTAAIYEQTKKAMNYARWQMYITIVLVVLPLLALLVLMPIMMRSIGSLNTFSGGIPQ